MTKELTKGNVLKLIFEFSIPILFGVLFQQFYNIVDTIIVGQFIGIDALAAVGSSGSLNFLIIGFCVGICTGFAIPVARSFGARNYDEMRKFLAGATILSIGISLVLTILTVVYCRPLLILMQTPADIIDRANSYIRIIYIGIPFIILFNMVASILRAVGNSRTPLYFLIIASALNIFLDLLFIMVFRWDVAGAALATVLAQGVAGFICLVYMRKKFAVLKINREDWKIEKYHLTQLCRDGIPMGLQFSITAVGAVVLQVAVNGLGSLIVAVTTTAQRISMFFFTPFEALGSTMATFTGQNTGARQFERLKKGVYYSCLIGIIYSLLAFGFMKLFGIQLGKLFIGADNPEILEMIQYFLLFLTGFYAFVALVHIIRLSIQGMGFGGIAMFAGIFEMVARGVFGLLVVPTFGFTAVCLASPAAWVLADLFLVPAFFYCLNKLKKQKTCKECCHAELPPLDRHLAEDPFLS